MRTSAISLLTAFLAFILCTADYARKPANPIAGFEGRFDTLLKNDPLFDGFGKETVMLEQHVSECVRLPPEFEVLASSDACHIQAIKHKTKPLYATQFHPEAYEEKLPDGKWLLQNFFRIASHAK